MEQEKKEYKQAGEGEAKSVSWLAGWWMSCSFFLGVAKNRLVLGLKAAPTSPECASTGVRGDPTPRRGELTRVRGCDRTWRCHGRDRAWRGYQQRVCVDGNVVRARVCVCV